MRRRFAGVRARIRMKDACDMDIGHTVQCCMLVAGGKRVMLVRGGDHGAGVGMQDQLKSPKRLAQGSPFALFSRLRSLFVKKS